jgi:hypothetical protein
VSALDEAPDFAEPFEGWRVWRVVVAKDGYRLGSVVKPTIWPAGRPLVAECLRAPQLRWFRRRREEEHVVPEEPCECGIYAARLAVLGPYVRDRPVTPAVARVLGRVSLWGRVIECERGFRASHAYPACVFVPGDCSFRREHRCEEIAAGLEVYGVPVEPLTASCSEAVSVLEEI